MKNKLYSVLKVSLNYITNTCTKHKLMFGFIFQKISLVIAGLLLISLASQATIITSTTSGGVWSVGSSWVGGVAPVSNVLTDNVVIASGATITLTAATQIGDVTINSGGVLTCNAALSMG